MNKKNVSKDQLGLQPYQVALVAQARRQKKSKHTIFRSIGSPAKHVRRLHPRRGE